MATIKKILVYIALFIIAAGAGSVISGVCAKVNALSWLSLGPSFGFDPVKINLIVMDFTFGLNVHLTVAHIILLIIVIFAAPKIAAALVKG